MHSLRDATQNIHRQLEAAPLSHAMVAGNVTRADYVALLLQLVHIHRCLETHLSKHPALHAVYQPSMVRLPALLRDLDILDPEAAEPPLPVVRALTQRIADWSATNPLALLGCLYVFEGSRLGSMYLSKPLGHALDVPVTMGAGIDYHVQDMDQRQSLWQKFQQTMNAFISESDHDVVVAAAVATFNGLNDLYVAASAPAMAAPTIDNIPWAPARA